MSTLEPITRNEKFYKAIADNDSTGLPEPKTREELYLNAIATGNKEGLPEPVTRQEIFLREIAENGGGGDVTIEPLTVTENGTYSEDGKAYKPVVVDVATPENAYLLKSATDGDIVTFTDGANLPMPSLKVNIEPAQDLHGYDAPWVGGAGKNKFDKSTVNVDKYIGADGNLAQSQYNQDVTDYIPVVSGQTYMISHARNTKNYSCFYDENKTMIGSVFANNQFPIEAPTNAKYMRVTFGKADVDAFQVEIGTTSTSYVPYSNICPISGWDEVEVGLYKAYQICEADNFTETTSNGLTMTYLGKGKFRVYGTMTNNVETTLRANIKEFVIYGGDDSYINLHNSKSGHYTLMFRNSSTEVDPWGFSTVNRTSSYIGMRNKTTNNIVMIVNALLYGTDIDLTFAPEIYSNNTKYTYPVTFTDGTNPLTVYGGYVDLVNGVMTVDRISVTVDENSNIISESGGLPFRIDLLTGAKPSSSASALTGVKCNFLKEVTQSSSWGVNGTFSRVTTDAKTVYFKVNSEITTIQQLKTFLQSNNLQFVYELATPITYQLTPTLVKSLLNTNNVWHSCNGGITDLTYFSKA